MKRTFENFVEVIASVLPEKSCRESTFGVIGQPTQRSVLPSYASSP